MHIKQVVIEGFKSYKDQAITEPFSRSINVVVGANGSGKSNFFHAIRFVLNDAFVNMRAEERQQLLHEGAGHAVTSAYVEIVFDNSDGRFPLDRDEVRLRRTIGVKKDEYHLDKKHINKSEVTNLLESAGFSKANPYYIVQQGKITAMSQMKDEERMQLLKEIGGTRVYEERREESLKLMKETESRRAQIEEMVASLDAKLKELESERAEMIEYQAAERTRRCLEFTLLDRDERAAREQLVQVEQQHKEESARSGAAHDGAHKAHSELAELAAQMRAAEAKRKATEASQVDVLTRRNEVVAKRAAADADVRELKDKVVRNTTMAGLAEKELATLDAEIAAQKEQLAAVVAELTAVEAEEATARRGQDDAKARQQQLRLKQGRKAQFASEAERDSSLKAEMKKVEGVVTQKQATLAATTAELRRRNEELMELAQAIGDKESELRGAEEVAAAAERQLAALKLQRDGAQDAKKDRWRQDNERDASAAVTQVRAAHGTHRRAGHTGRADGRGLLGARTATGTVRGASLRRLADGAC